MALTVLILAFVVAHGWISWRQDDERAEALVTTLTRTLEFQTDASFRSIDNLLMEASQRIDPDAWPDPALVHWFQSRLVAFPEARNLLVAKASGQSAGPGLSAAGMVGQTIDVSDRQHFAQHKDGKDNGAMIIATPIIDRFDGRQVIPLSRSIVDSSGNFKGIVAIGLDPQFLVKALERLLIEDAGGISVIRSDGLTLARLPDQYGSFGRSVAKSDLFTKFVARSPSGIARFVSVADGNAKIVGYRTLERYPLVATVGITERTAYQRVRLESMALAIVVLVLGPALYWFAALFDRRTNAMAEMARTTDAREHAAGARLVAEGAEIERLRTEGAAQTRLLTETRESLELMAYLLGHGMKEPVAAVLADSDRLGVALDDQAVANRTWLSNLLSDLSAYARVVAADPVPAPCDLTEIAAEARGRVEHPEMVVEIGKLPVVIGDRIQIAAVFRHLLDNSVRCRGKDRTTTVRVDSVRRGSDWLIRFRDDGAGMDGSVLEKSFSVFEYLSPDHPGLPGIGLPICRTIIQRHGGRVWIESEPGKGTNVFVTFPGPGPE